MLFSPTEAVSQKSRALPSVQEGVGIYRHMHDGQKNSYIII